MRVLSNPPMSVTLGEQPEIRVLSIPPMSKTLGGTRGNEGVIQPTNVCDFEGNKGK